MKKIKKIRLNPKNIIIVIIVFVLFMIISLTTLNKSYSNLVNYLLDSFNKDNTRVNVMTSNLDNLINTYYFKNKNTIINNR